MAKQCNRREEEVPSDSDLELTFTRLLMCFEDLRFALYLSASVSHNSSWTYKGSHSRISNRDFHLSDGEKGGEEGEDLAEIDTSGNKERAERKSFAV